MIIPHNAIIDRVQELGFSSENVFLFTMKMAVAKAVWIVNDKTDTFGFAQKDITLKELQENKLWPN